MTKTLKQCPNCGATMKNKGRQHHPENKNHSFELFVCTKCGYKNDG